MKNSGRKKNNEQDIFPLSENRFVESKTVIVCFADIRGFTSFVQKDILNEHRLIEKLLECSYKALNKAIIDAEINIDFETPFGNSLRNFTRPTLTKPLGDGVMLVWECPNSLTDEVRIGFKLYILDFVQLFQSNYYNLKMSLENLYPEHLSLLQTSNIGIGLASGDAWKFSGFGTKGVDYASNIINLAARLQDKARPMGLVVRITYEYNLFLERRYSNREGLLEALELKGMSEPVVVWKVTDKPIISGRRSRKVNNFLDAQKSFENIDDFNVDNSFPLTPDDTQNIFDIRVKFEVQFVTDLCERLKTGQLSDEELHNINPNKSGELFHEQIAHYSTNDLIESEQRAKFIAWAYEKTKIVRSYAGDDATEVHKQHSRIFKAIEAKNTQAASDLMRKHLMDNCNTGRSKLITKLISDVKQNKKDNPGKDTDHEK